MSTYPTKPEITARLASERLGVDTSPAPEPEHRVYRQTPKGKAKKKEAKQLIPHQWKKGQSGNPKGRPINPLSLTALLNKKLSENPEDAEAIVNALIALGKGKDIRAIEMSFERIDGKVAEVHKLEKAMSITLIFRPAEELLAQKPMGIIEGEFKEIKEGG